MKRLYARIYVHFIGVLIVVGIASSIVFATGWRTDFVRNWMLRLSAHAAWTIGRQPDAQGRAQMMKHLSDELGVDVALRSPDGAPLAGTGEPLPALDDGDRRQVITLGPQLIHHHRRWVAAAPVRDREGHLVALFEAAPMHRFAPWSILRPLVTVALVLLVVGVATFPLARRISRPVERLTEATRRFGAGDLSYRVRIDHERRRHRFARRFGHRHRHRHHHHHALDELVELTRAWNDMAERIEKLVRGQRELLANVSHELRSPLARIRLALELLPDDVATVARRRDLGSDLDELERLIDDVLTTSRLEATGLPVHLQPVSLPAMCEQLAERAAVDPLTQGKPLALSLDGAGEIEADPALLKRALWNLVENAAKYGAPPIALEAARAGDKVTLTVSDEGAGIPPEDRERVFDPFFRRDKARTPGQGADRGGFGLGLTLAKRVAEVHGGNIRIDAAHDDGRGCRITLELPTTSSASLRAADEASRR